MMMNAPVTLTVNAKGHYEIGGVDLVELAGTQKTPLYVMDKATLIHNARYYTQTLKTHYPNHLVVYAGKACMNIGLLNVLNEEGLGVDVVSGGELVTALKSNIPNTKIVFHGNNKSLSELEVAIQNQVRLVADNTQEIENICDIAARLKTKAIVLVRVKPGIEAHTHHYIKTGQIDSKFGIDKADIPALASRLNQEEWIEFRGLHSHIGSQIFDTKPYLDLVDIMGGMVRDLHQSGIPISELNLGGGFGIQYTKEDNPPDIPTVLAQMADRLTAFCESNAVPKPKLIVEPGRAIVGTAGVTLYDVGTIKEIPGLKTFLFVDGGMADNPRPIMYQAKYTFALANKAQLNPSATYDIAGKFCESGDILAKGVTLPNAEKGDTLLVFGTGAYNYAMASNYNRALKPAMVLVDNGHVHTLVRRETFEDLLRCDTV